MWQRVAREAGFGAHAFHFHDIRAEAASDAPSEQYAQQLLDHTDPRTTCTAYRRRPTEAVPLKRVSKNAS